MNKKGLGLVILSAITALTSACNCSDSFFNEVADLNKIIGWVSYSARKYDNSMTMKKIASEIGVEEITNQEQFFDAIHFAFKDVMPELDSARKNLGDFELLNSYSDNEIANIDEDYVFFMERGLVNVGQPYEKEKEVDLSYAKVFLNRIHSYIGTSLTDNFGAANNNELIFGSEYKENGLQQITSIGDNETLLEKIDSIVVQAKNEGNLKYKPLVDLYNLKGTTLNIDNDIGLKSIIKNNREIASFTDYVHWERELGNLTLQNTFFSMLQSAIYQNTDPADCEEIPYYAILSIKDYSSMLFLHTLEDVEYVTRYLVGNANLVNNQIYGEDNFDAEDKIENINKLLLEVKKTAVERGEDSLEYIMLNGNDPFIDGGLKSEYSYSSFIPEDVLEHKELFMMYGFDYLYYSIFAEYMKDSDYLESFKDLSLVTFLLDNQVTIITEENGLTLDEIALAQYGEHMIMSYYQTTDEYKLSVNALRDLCDNKLKPALRELFNRSSWLSKEGKKIATEKLNNMTSSYLYEYEGHEYNSNAFNVTTDKGLFLLKVSHDKTLICGLLNAYKDSKGDERATVFYQMSPFTVNAAYAPTYNGFFIFAGLVFCKKPIYQMSLEEQLAEFGTIIGHEMTHGFDSSGVYYTEDGNYVSESILPKEDCDRFQELSTKMGKYYDNAEVITGVSLFGGKVIGEAIADQGGLNMCLEIAKKDKNFNYELFFKDFAAHFYVGGNRGYIVYCQINDVHPFGTPRINLLFSNCPKFIETFKIKKGDMMYLDPSEQFVIW